MPRRRGRENQHGQEADDHREHQNIAVEGESERTSVEILRRGKQQGVDSEASENQPGGDAKQAQDDILA